MGCWTPERRLSRLLLQDLLYISDMHYVKIDQKTKINKALISQSKNKQT